MFTVLAVGWENRATAWQITIVAPVGLGLGALLAMPERGSVRPPRPRARRCCSSSD